MVGSMTDLQIARVETLNVDNLIALQSGGSGYNLILYTVVCIIYGPVHLTIPTNETVNVANSPNITETDWQTLLENANTTDPQTGQADIHPISIMRKANEFQRPQLQSPLLHAFPSFSRPRHARRHHTLRLGE